MNSRELKNIIEQIQKAEGIKIAQIAALSGVNRSYLSTLINSEVAKDIEDAFVGKISKHFSEYFHNKQKPTDKNKIDQILANLDELRGYTIAILTGQSAGHEVIMGSLERMEEKPEGSFSAAADKLALQIAERLNKIQKGKKAGAHT